MTMPQPASPPGGWLPPLPPGPPREQRRWPWVLTGVLLVVVLVTGVSTATLLVGGSDEDAAGEVRAGDCVDLVLADGVSPPSGPAFAATAERIDCADPAASYEVAVLLPDPEAACPSTVYTTHIHELGGAEPVRLCLTYNVDEGECFVEDPPDSGPFDCADGERADAIKILRVLDGVEDIERCKELDEPALAVSVPEPPTTFCFIPFGARSGDGVAT